MKKRILSIMVSFSLILSIISFVPITSYADYENTYINTGNQRLDIIGVAQTQVGNTNSSHKYRSDNASWCASFVVWCARQAGIDESIIKTTGWADADDLGVTYTGRSADRTVGISYTPQSGDLIIFDWGSNGYNYQAPASAHGDHVGLVEYVENGYVHTIEGNSSNQVRRRSYPLSSSDIKGYGIPNYKGSHFEGNVDLCEGGTNNIRVGGWAFDRNDTSKSIDIHIYIGGPAGSENAEGHAIVANQERTDVNNVYGSGNYHGFSSTISTSKVGNQEVYIYAVNGDNKFLGKYDVNINDIVGTDTTSPVVLSKSISYSDSNGYTIQCTVSDNIGIKKVRVATWTEDNGQDDILWNDMILQSDGVTWQYYVPFADHSNQYNVLYNNHIYPYDYAGNFSSSAIDFNDWTKAPINPEGYVDNCIGIDNYVYVRGWAFDRSDSNTPLDIHVYIGGDVQTGEGHSIKANKERIDVDDANHIGTNHGFEAQIVSNLRGRQEVYIYALNVGGGENRFLGSYLVDISESKEVETPTLSMSSDRNPIDQKSILTFTWNQCHNATGYNLYIAPNIYGTVEYDWDNSKIYLPGQDTISFQQVAANLSIGAYAAVIEGWDINNNIKSSLSNYIYFYVNETNDIISSDLQTPTLSSSQNDDMTNIRFNWTTSGYIAYGYNLYIAPLIEGTVEYDWQNKRRIYLPGHDTLSYENNDLKPGAYSAYIVGWNYDRSIVSNPSNYIWFVVKGKKYNLNFETGVNNLNIETRVVTNGKTFGVLPLVTREGYNFLGWFTDADNGIKINDNSVVDTTTDITLYAHWEYISPHTETQVVKNGNAHNISISQTNLETAKILVGGYKDGMLVSMEVLNNDNLQTTFTGDFDTFKVMAWENLSTLKPLCEAETIPQSSWIIE